MKNQAGLTIDAPQLRLENVPRIGFDVHLSPFPGALYALLDYCGDHQAYDYLMGITGAAFRRLWNPDDGGNIDLARFGEMPFRLAFTALGYRWRRLPAEKATMLAAIKTSLAHGVPPISFGICGPPEAGLVTGYAEDGAVLYGWSYFQPTRDGYYELRDWFTTMDKSSGYGLLVLGEKTPPPPPREILLTALEWAIDLACTSRRSALPNHVSGLAAYEAWADALVCDADYPADKADALAFRTMIYGDQCMMVEDRREAARFLRRMKSAAPCEAALLAEAATLYDNVAALVYQLWPWPVEPNAGAIQGLSDPAQRRQLAVTIRTAREQEARAVALLEKVWIALR
ncbi:MAG: hypothetical protein DYG89_02220 [Caldilinea sp. CFX5]|nr:hypothetical protein [Caldilinea sp. CFX5]